MRAREARFSRRCGGTASRTSPSSRRRTSPRGRGTRGSYDRDWRPMRLFLAVEFEQGLRRALREATAPLRALAPDAGWVAEDRLHLTLKFLGEQSEELVPRLAAAIGEIAGRHWPVPMQLRGVGAFPNLRRPRVMWVGIAPTPKLELLQHDIEE